MSTDIAQEQWNEEPAPVGAMTGRESHELAAMAFARTQDPGGSLLGPMLSAPRIPVERTASPGSAAPRDTRALAAPGDKFHPRHRCNGHDLLERFTASGLWRLEDREREMPGTWQWHLALERP